jgi:hypothetical protein
MPKSTRAARRLQRFVGPLFLSGSTNPIQGPTFQVHDRENPNAIVFHRVKNAVGKRP